ncbi:MAG: hypothetical protein IKD03_01635, partial [Clostridia bacterium]|nr:hypothetical protein [Clostridia bacterium]
GLKPVHYIPSLRNRLCLRARFFAPLKNDSARKITTIPRGQTCWYGLKAVKHIPCLRNRL